MIREMHKRCVEPGVEATIMAQLDADFANYKDKLNLACGADYREGWTNHDGDSRVKADVYFELEGMAPYKMPFSVRSFDLVYASHILEHIHNLQELKAEIYRILKPGGDLICIVPSYLSIDAWGNPTHCRAFSTDSFINSQFWPGEYEREMHLYEIEITDGKGYSPKWIISRRTKVK